MWKIVHDGMEVELWALGGASIEEDIRRRDFSCNALMWPLPGGPILDLVDGIRDIRDRRLRGLERRNFERDPLRLLRAARFLAQLEGFELDDALRDWLRDLAPRLKTVPRERVGKELGVLLEAPSPMRGLETMITYGLMPGAAPGTKLDHAWLDSNLDGIRMLASPAVHPLRSALVEAGPSALLCVLLRSWSCPTHTEVSAYAWPKERAGRASRAARALDEAESILGHAIQARREFLARLGNAAPPLIAAGAALSRGQGAPTRAWANL